MVRSVLAADADVWKLGASGPSVARAAKEQLKNPIPKPIPSNYVVSILKDIPRNQITARDVAEAVRKGDKLAAIVWNEAMRWIGIGVASAANILNPGNGPRRRGLPTPAIFF